jgi:dihydrofolate reductase
MPKQILIVCRDAVCGIGRDGTLPWHSPEDLRHFRNVTMGKTVIMGRKTLTAIGRQLPGRHMVALSRNTQGTHPPYATVVSSLDTALGSTSAAVCIIGGQSVYASYLQNHEPDCIYMTTLHKTFGCDTFFPSELVHWEHYRLAASRTILQGQIDEFVKIT